MKIEEFAHTLLFGTTLEDKLLESPAHWDDSGHPKKDDEKQDSTHQLELDSRSPFKPHSDLSTSHFLHPSSPHPSSPHPSSPHPSSPHSFSSFETPLFPGRPKHLSRIGKSEFPSTQKLKLDSERGKVLHFFANHELLAMELMALVLLKFPKAPTPYRQGVVRIIQEEQNHLKLYISRMRELGIDFGDFPVNDYFWNCMKDVRSPLDFTVQMSLTFEQANLDFSLFYLNEVSRVGDEATAAILDRVFREEIGHVKHGLVWFNRWRPDRESQSDWQEYQNLLPYPLNPQRAKGTTFSEEARRQAGLSETFIQELKIYSGSKGRPPVVWHYNSHCDSEIARGKPGYSPSQSSQRTAEDLSLIPIFLAHKQDILLTPQRVSRAWIEELQEAGFSTPELIGLGASEKISSKIRADKLGGLEPWGWSPDALEFFRPIQNRLIEMDGGNSAFCQSLYENDSYFPAPIKDLFSKSWSTLFLKNWMIHHPNSLNYFGPMETLGSQESSLEQVMGKAHLILLNNSCVMLKAPFGTSGMQNKKIQSETQLSSPQILGWIKRILQQQGSLVIEPYLEKLFDLSLQFEVKKERIEILEARRFITGSRFQYQGTYLGKKMMGFEPKHHQLFHQTLPHWHEMIRELGKTMREHGYLGPAGVDAMIYEYTPRHLHNTNTSPSPLLFLKPLVELNPRWTMGRVALELEKHIDPGVSAIWKWMSLPDILSQGYPSIQEYVNDLKSKHPLRWTPSPHRKSLRAGILFTNPPDTAKTLITFLQIDE